VIPEPLGGAHRDPHTAAHSLGQYIAKTLKTLKDTVKRNKIEHVLERRYEKFRNLGVVMESGRKSAKVG
jgi:acetyl-CoA carboxylase carboxyl transferase subunit alpha